VTDTAPPTLRAVREPPRPNPCKCIPEVTAIGHFPTGRVALRVECPRHGALLRRFRRSLTPPTLRAADVHRLDVVRERLRFALRTADTLGELRKCVVELAANIEAAIGEDAAETVRADSVAPNTPHGSKLGQEFGESGSLWTVARGED
jgi:hypothetical protein